MGIKNGFGGPDLTQLFDPEQQPVAVVMAWLDEGVTYFAGEIGLPNTTGPDRDQMEKYRKWCNGTDLPDRQSITRFSTALMGTGRIEEAKLPESSALVDGRTDPHLERNSPVPFRGAMRRRLLDARFRYWPASVPVVNQGSVFLR